MIPTLTDQGVLPPGVHAATFAEVEVRFATDARRRTIWDGFTKYRDGVLSPLRQEGLVRSVIFGGSFLTSEKQPKDIDILVEVTLGFAVAVTRTSGLMRMFDHAYTEPYLVQAKPWAPSAVGRNNLLVLWQMPSDRDVAIRGVDPDKQKGVVRVPL